MIGQQQKIDIGVDNFLEFGEPKRDFQKHFLRTIGKYSKKN
jgi:hypothetical protein